MQHSGDVQIPCSVHTEEIGLTRVLKCRARLLNPDFGRKASKASACEAIEFLCKCVGSLLEAH
jgi:hypothetical protein